MPRRRFSLDANSGLLTDRDGNVLGRVISLTLDEAPQGGKGGLSGASGSTATATATAKDEAGARGGLGGRPTASRLEREAVQSVWDYYQQVIPSRRALDDKRKRIITNALRTMRQVHDCDLSQAEGLVKRAVLGLSRSPHHNGENEQRKSYLEIRYALKGIGDESDDERIEKAITWAVVYSPTRPAAERQPVAGAKVERWLDEVRYHLGKLALDPDTKSGRERATEAYRKLKAAGFEVERLDRPPYARVK